MSNDQINKLYQEIILKHNKIPRNYGVLEDATHEAEEINMLCGDEVRVFMRFVDDRCDKVMFTGYGCAVMKASASLMTTVLEGCSRAEVLCLIDSFHNLINGNQHTLSETSPLRDLQGVQFYPARIKCAFLPWKAVSKGLSATM